MKTNWFAMVVGVCIMAGMMDLEAVDQKLLTAISAVESNHKDSAVGDSGRALGRFQLWKTYVDDVNRIAKTKYTWEDAKDPVKAMQMVKLYLNFYGRRYQKITGKPATREVLARIHNGGPNGFEKSCTDVYWTKVQKYL